MRYEGPARLELKGDQSKAQKYIGLARTQMGRMLNFMRSVHIKSHVWRRHYPIENVFIETLVALPHVLNIRIEVVGAEVPQEVACSLKGFLIQADGFDKFLVSPEDYDEIRTDQRVIEAQAGFGYWVGGETKARIISWDENQFGYMLTPADSFGYNVYRGGCLYAIAPGKVMCAGVFEGKLVVVTYGVLNPNTEFDVYAVSFRGQAYTVDDPPDWQTVLSRESLPGALHVAQFAPDGASFVLNSDITFKEYEVTANLDGELSVSEIDHWQSNPAPSTVSGGVEDVPEDYTSGHGYTPLYTDNSVYLTAYYDVQINTEFECGKSPHALSVGDVVGPISSPDSASAIPEAPGENTLRAYMVLYKTDRLHGCRYMPDWTPPEQYAGTVESWHTRNLGKKHPYNRIVNPSFRAIIAADYTDTGERVELTVGQFSGTGAYHDGVGNTSFSGSTSGSVHTLFANAEEVLLTAISEWRAAAEAAWTVIPPCPAAGLSGGLSTRLVFVEDYSSDFAITKQVTSESTTTTTRFTGGFITETCPSYFAGRQINLYERDSQGGDVTTEVTTRTNDYSHTSHLPSLGVGGYSDCSGGDTVVTTSPDVVDPVLVGTIVGRIYMAFNLSAGIALIAETTQEAVNNNTWEGSTRLYWSTPNGDIGIAAMPGIFVSNPEYYDGDADQCYYPRGTNAVTHGELIDFKAQILNRVDDVLMHVSCTLLGVEINDIRSYKKATGVTVAEHLGDTTPVSASKVL